jgi:hypothetical protein
MKLNNRIAVGLVILLGALVFFCVNWLLREGPLVSDPRLPRPWAEKRFKELTTKPTPSTESPRDSRFATACGPPVRTKMGWETTIDLPRDEFIPDYEIVETHATGTFETKEFRGKMKCLAGNYFAPDLSENYRTPGLLVYLPDGSLVGKEEQEAHGITVEDLRFNSGWHQGFTSLVVSVELDGCQNPEVRNRGFLDADTHVFLGNNPQEEVRDDGFCVSDSVPVLHDARLMAVVDIAHGEPRDVIIPLKVGEVVEDPAFRLEVLETTTGDICGSGSNSGGLNRIVRRYDNPPSGPKPSFSVIYQIDPPVMEAAVTVDALDAQGNPMESIGRFMDLVPVSRFTGDLANAVSLRVRYRPKMTRLLLQIGKIPCADPANRAPKDLFDVRSADVSFRDSYDMRSFISETTELEMVQSPYDDTGAGFPIVMTRPTPREVVERYRALPGSRRVNIDTDAMTVEFESGRQIPMWREATGWLRRRGLIP